MNWGKQIQFRHKEKHKAIFFSHFSVQVTSLHFLTLLYLRLHYFSILLAYRDRKERQFFDEEAACEDDFEDEEDENDHEELGEDEQNDFIQEDGEALENSDCNDDEEEEV